MAWCYECDKNIDSDEDICPVCGAILDQDSEACGGDCSDCALGCEHGESSCEDCTGDLWPVDDEGNHVKPVLLMNVSGTQVDYEMTISLLRSFGIPTARDYPSAGRFVKLLTGLTGAGMDIYVPENMRALAKELLEAKPAETVL